MCNFFVNNCKWSSFNRANTFTMDINGLIAKAINVQCFLFVLFLRIIQSHWYWQSASKKGTWLCTAYIFHWMIWICMCKSSAGYFVQTHIHQNHSEWGEVVFKELCLPRSYYSGSHISRGRRSHIKVVGFCHAYVCLKPEVPTLFIGVRILLAK